MRQLLLLLTLIVSFNSIAEMRVPVRCEEGLAQVSTTNLIFFNTAEVLNIGKCVGVELVKKGIMNGLPKACDEVVENNSNLLGSLSLSINEAIHIGQCMGVINYVYERYNGERYNLSRYDRYSSKYKKYIYQCDIGMVAVRKLITTNASLSSRSKIRDVLCETQLERY